MLNNCAKWGSRRCHAGGNFNLVQFTDRALSNFSVNRDLGLIMVFLVPCAIKRVGDFPRRWTLNLSNIIAPVAAMLVLGSVIVGLGNPIVASTKKQYVELRETYFDGRRANFSIGSEGLVVKTR